MVVYHKAASKHAMSMIGGGGRGDRLWCRDEVVVMIGDADDGWW